ncbi:hypothetical protein [Faecalibaculum rodentium]|uniref:hypothetical protein n=1 Tax=Faecalibaculum rodentium TaxID=1702221 RepID=UPI00321FB886
MKTRDNDISTFLHWLNIALWMDHPQDLTSPSVRKKRQPHLHVEQAVCHVDKPDDISAFLHSVQVIEELSPLLLIIDAAREAEGNRVSVNA